MDYDSSVLDILGRDGVIYVAPSAPHPEGEPATYPMDGHYGYVYREHDFGQ